MRPIILYRDFDFEEHELKAASAHFECTNSRIDIRPDDLVIGRYSVLPFYREQERDITKLGAKLINTYAQHQYVADIREWYEDLENITPLTWFNLSDIPENGPFVLKGMTNSKKFLWDTHMFARNKRDAIDVYGRLMDDTFICQQPVYVREYIPLKKLIISSHGLPISVEFRFFIAYGEVVSKAFYWSSHSEDVEIPDVNLVPDSFINNVISRISDKINFYVVDIALTADDEWIVIELNDGQMSGLSDNEPNVLYKNLLQAIERRQI